MNVLVVSRLASTQWPSLCLGDRPEVELHAIFSNHCNAVHAKEKDRNEVDAIFLM